MEILSANQGVTDEQAVAAVRDGDVDRYRELVERHQRLVYAIAWSRLGDANLAEEVTQETFIRAYQRLPLLGSGTKFSHWIATIARNLAINFGLRHRRELSKRERWALEVDHSQSESAVADKSAEEICTPETLRETMAGLPSGHRECLVLFYLEHKSNAEAAAILGIAEATFRVRLHRARVALREQLEAKLSESLEQLRPPKPVTPEVMASVLAMPPGKAGVFSALLKLLPSAVLKSAPVKIGAGLPFFLMIVPGWVMQWMLVRAEARNFRDRDGFRAKFHRDDSRTRLVVIPLLTAAGFGLSYVLTHSIGFGSFYIAIAFVSALNTFVAIRNLVLCQTRETICTASYLVALTFTCFAVGCGLIAARWIGLVAMIAMIGGVFSVSRPMRMDYNLFLRAAQGMLGGNEDDLPPITKRDRHDLKRFAAFLYERGLVRGYRWLRDGLSLDLYPVRPTVAASYFSRYLTFGVRRSNITLRYDGKIEAFLNEKDEERLIETGTGVSSESLHRQVIASVAHARAVFEQGNIAKAERFIGHVPDSEVFVDPSMNMPSRRRYIRFALAMVVSAMVVVAIKHYEKASKRSSAVVTQDIPATNHKH